MRRSKRHAGRRIAGRDRSCRFFCGVAFVGCRTLAIGGMRTRSLRDARIGPRQAGYVEALGSSCRRTSRVIPGVPKVRHRSQKPRDHCAKISWIITGGASRDSMEHSGGICHPEAHSYRALSRGTAERGWRRHPSVERLPEGSCARCNRSNSTAERALHHVCLSASERESTVYSLDEY